MTLAVEKSALFETDVTRQFGWHVDAAGEALAWRFFTAVDSALAKLARQPDLGRVRHFRNPRLRGLRSFRVVNGSTHYRALLLPLRRWGVSPREIRATGTQPDAGSFIPRGEPVAWP